MTQAPASAMAMALYPYQPLKLPHEIRILTLLPGLGDDKIICNLSHVEIESNEKYDALSYCWSKSIAQPLDLDEVVNLIIHEPGSPKETRRVAVRELLDDPEAGFLYIKYGGVLPDGTIVCDGSELMVGGELFRALRCLRHPTEPQRLWVDAVCINQTDIQERTEYVKIMGSVYRNASTVRIWLGDEIRLEKNVFQALRHLTDIFNDLQSQLQELDSQPAKAQSLCMSHAKWYDVEWSALAHFFDRAWFERVWVVQEVANAKEAVIHIGRYQIPWEAVSGILDLLTRFRLSDHIGHTSATMRAATMGDLRDLVIRGNHVPESLFISVLDNLRDFKSTIPCDKIYGILGILDPTISIEVDYSKSAEHVFTDLAVQYLQNGFIDLLYRCGEPHQSTSLQLPSWVPDWTRRRWTSPFYVRELECNATGNAQAHISVDSAAGNIRVRGRFLDTVRIVDDEAEIPVTKFDPNEQTAYDSEQDAKAKTKEKLRIEQRKVRDAGEKMLRLAWRTPDDFSWESYENLWRTFICNRLADGSVPPRTYGMIWEAYMTWTYNHTATANEESDGPYYKKILIPYLRVEDIFKRTMFADIMLMMVPEFANANRRWCYNRRFFISEGERYGWVVDGTRSADRVAVIYGCKYPFLLRDAGDGTYKIIGDCYIHGLMDGEALGDEFKEVELIIS